MKGRIWTKMDEEQLKRLIENGKSVKEISGIIDRSMRAVYGKCKQMGLRVNSVAPRVWSAKEDELLKTWTGTVEDLAKKLQRTKDGVLLRMDALGGRSKFPFKRDRPVVAWSQQEKRRLQELIDEFGESKAVLIAVAELGRSKKSIRGMIDRFKLLTQQPKSI